MFCLNLDDSVSLFYGEFHLFGKIHGDFEMTKFINLMRRIRATCYRLIIWLAVFGGVWS